MRSSLFIASHDLRLALRQKETLLWVFLMPGLFFYFIGTVTGGMGSSGGPGEGDPLVLDVGVDAGFLAAELEQRLDAAGYELTRGATPTPEELAAAGDDAPRGPWLRIPDGFTATVLAASEADDPATVTLALARANLLGDFDQFRAGRAVYQVLADLVATSAAGEDPGAESFAALHARPRSLTVESRPAGKRRTIPSGFQQTIPGTMVMFTLIVLLTSSVLAVIVERRSGVLRRLASAPIGRGRIVLGKWGAAMALGLVQIGVAMAIGTLAFGMDWGPDLPTVLLVLLAWAALVASLSLLLGSLLNSEGQAVAVGVLSANVLGALGGCWWPIEVAPGWMQDLQLFLPTGWVMDAMHKLVSFEAGPASVLPHVLGMFAAALLLGGLGARFFRFQ